MINGTGDGIIDETTAAGIPAGATDSDRVKQYHRTSRFLSVVGYIVDFVLLLILRFAVWSVALRTAAFH